MAFILVAVNKSNLADISEYEVTAFSNETRIWKGTVSGHTRADGWQELVRKIAESAEGK